MSQLSASLRVLLHELQNGLELASPAWNYVGIVLLIACSAFFSGTEIAYASANRLRLRARAESGERAAALAFRLYEGYDNALISILVGNNLVNMASSSIATVIAISLMGDEGAWVATVIMTVIILLFGEIMPKILAVETADRFAVRAAVPLRAFTILTFPLVWLVNRALKLLDPIWLKKLPESPAVTEDDLESILDTVEDEGVLDEDRCDLLQSALDFDDVLAYEIITPRVDMTSIDIDDDMDETLRTALDSPYSRIPVYEDTVDHIIGILHLNHLFKEMADTDDWKGIDIRRLMMPVYFVHKTMPLPDVLKTMKRHQCHMVIVTDEYGGTMGLVTMEDVLEQLVGDIWDESDEVVDEFVQLAPDLFEADGDMRIYDFFEELDIDDRDFDDDNATLGGWAIEMLGRYPRLYDSFVYKNLTITVKRIKNLRVTRLLVRVHPLPEGEEEESF